MSKLVSHGGVRDAVWDFIPMYDHEKEAVKLPLFNVANSKKQLGCSDFEYPSAVHTRASHMYGAMHRTSVMIDLLGRDFLRKAYGTDCNETFDLLKKATRLAALYHDVGHGPFSHVCDEFVYSYIYDVSHHGHDCARLDLLSQDGDFLHLLEKSGLSFADSNNVIGSIVSSWQTPNGYKLKESQPFDPFLHAIVQGPLGADRQDYLERDAHMTGYPCGRFSPHRLTSFMRVVPWMGESKDGCVHNYRLGVLDKGLVEIDNLSYFRANMFHQVYQNPNVVAPSLLIGLAVRSSVMTDDPQIDWEDLMGSPESFSKLTDDAFVQFLRSDASVTEATTLYADDFFFRRNIPQMIKNVVCDDVGLVSQRSSELLTRVVKKHKNKLSSYLEQDNHRHEITRDENAIVEGVIEHGVLVHPGEFYQYFELDRLQKNQVSIVPRNKKNGCVAEGVPMPIASYFDRYPNKVACVCPHNVMASTNNYSARGMLRAFVYKDYEK